MNHFQKSLKRNTFKKIVEINTVVKTFIQPFKEMPCIIKNEQEDRISAHELFSLYTADVIREDIVYAR